MADYNLEKLFIDLLKKSKFDKEISYTSSLLASIEVILEYLDKNKNNVIKESADLLYHLCVMWISAGVKPTEVWNELQKRRGVSGLDEKKSRLR